MTDTGAVKLEKNTNHFLRRSDCEVRYRPRESAYSHVAPYHPARLLSVDNAARVHSCWSPVPKLYMFWKAYMLIAFILNVS
jgi:hypothetical protein